MSVMYEILNLAISSVFGLLVSTYEVEMADRLFFPEYPGMSRFVLGMV